MMPINTNCEARIMRNNFASLSATSITFSSFKTGFPGSNALDNFRTNFWIPAGRFLIDSTNEKIYFNDGAPQVGTVANSDYNSGSDLAVAIQTAMNAVSSGYTVSYSASTLKFTITRGTAFVLELSNSTNAIWNTLGWITSIDTSSLTSHSSEEGRKHWPYELIKMDFGHIAEVGFVGMVGELGRDFTISNAATVRVMGNNVDDFTSPPLDLVIPNTDRDRGILHFIDDQDSSYRFWEVRITDLYNPDDIQIGNFYFGSFETFEDANIAQGFNRTIEDNSIIEESENGTKFFDVRKKTALFGNLNIGVAPIQDVDLIWDTFEKVGLTAPFYFSIDPQVKISSRVSDLTKYVFFNDEPVYTHVFYNRYNISMSLKEAI